jgi:hypothetical protein
LLKIENQRQEVFKNKDSTRHLWLTPVILATQEAEIRRITVRSQPRQIVPRDSISKNTSQKELVEWLKL